MIGTSDTLPVIFTILVALIASYVAASTGKKERYWVTGGALAVGAGIWAMYFIGMLALRLPIPTSHNIPITVLSLLIVVMVSGFVLRTTNSVLEKRAAELSRANALLLQQQIQESKQVEQTRANLAAIVENANDAIIGRTFNGTIQSWNAAAERMLGYTAAEAVGRPVTFILPPGRQSNLARNTERVLNGEVVPPHESKRVTKDGRVIDVLVSISPVRDNTGEISGASVILHDISALKQALERLNYLAQHDALTGLPNRSLFRDRLAIAMANKAKRNGQMLALMFIDLDRFKEINDTLGHATGDAVLQAVAKLLTKSLREAGYRRAPWRRRVHHHPGKHRRCRPGDDDSGKDQANLPFRPLITEGGDIYRHRQHRDHALSARCGQHRRTAANRRRRHVSRQGGRTEYL